MWLDSLLTLVAPRNGADTLGPKQQIRINTRFWYGISSALILNAPYTAVQHAKGAARCPTARSFFGRLRRTKSALQLRRRVSPGFARHIRRFHPRHDKTRASAHSPYE